MKELKDHLIRANQVLISTHSLPDGDGLGAEVALYHYLKRTQKSCRIYNPDQLPRRYGFLDPKNTFLFGPGEVEIWDTFDLWIILDTNDPRRLGHLWKELFSRAKKIIFLDHHPTITHGSRGTHEAQLQYPSHSTLVSNPSASCIGELLYQLFSELKLAELDRDVAIGLYVSIMTDTNSFRYSGTTPLAHQIAAEMIQLGANPETIYQAIYSSKKVSHLQLLGAMLVNVQVSKSAKVAWLEMDLALRRKYLASADDTLSFLNILLLIQDAEIICFFREEDDGLIRVSIRSKGRVMVNQLAMELGGGGHAFSAGVALQTTLNQAVNLVVQRIETLINQHEKTGK